MLMILRAPWVRNYDFSFFEEIYLGECCGTPACDHKIGLTEDGGNCMRVNPIIYRCVWKVMEKVTRILVEESKKDDPFNIEILTCRCNRLKNTA